jgi:hypothetical protein
MRDVGRRVRTWSLPAVAYWISGPYNDPDRLLVRPAPEPPSGA